MAVSEPQRLALHRAARAKLGEEEGDTLMALTPPANTGSGDHAALRRMEEESKALLRREIAALHAEIARFRSDVTAAIHRSERRVMAVIILAFLGTNLIG